MNGLPARLVPAATLGSLFAAFAAPVGCAQVASAKVANAQSNGSSHSIEAGLPTFLLPVPGGEVWLGLTAEQLVDIACQAVNPADPDQGAKEENKVKRNLEQTASELGKARVKVDTFLLGKWPITNKEYKVFVEKTKHRFPFHWWRWGREDDYNKRIDDIRRQFPDEGINGVVGFWESHWRELPWALKDKSGKPIDDLPVTYVSWRDAVKFAAWLGMRLPDEAERTRAAKGNEDIIWLWAKKENGPGDKLDHKALDLLKVANMRDQVLKPVGTVQFAIGPFGHLDMTGQVWEFTSEVGFGLLAGKKEFDAEYKALQKLKLGRLLENPFYSGSGDVAVIKGGSYLSGGDPVQLHVDCRTRIKTDDVVQSVGLRLAKSPRPGYDFLYSLIRADYKTPMFAQDQQTDLAQQIGVERYDVGTDGFPEAYHAVSFAPVNWLTNQKVSSLKGLLDDSMVKPIVIGTLALTDLALVEPAIKGPGIYTVYFRQAGQSRELKDAISAGYKEVQAELKRKAAAKKSGTEYKPEEKDPPKEGANDWRTVLARYGLTETDLEPKDAKDNIKFIRINGVEVTTESNLLLFYDNDGVLRAILPMRQESFSAGNVAEPVLEIDEANANGSPRMRLKFGFGVPIEQRNLKRVTGFQMQLVVDLPPMTAEKPWRTPPQK